MAEMKTLNGYEIVDAQARDDLQTLRTNLVTTVEHTHDQIMSIHVERASYPDASALVFTYSTPVASIMELYTDYKSGISIQFTTAATITNTVTNVHFKGDDCEGGVFTPVADTEYEIALWSTASGIKAGVIKYEK